MTATLLADRDVAKVPDQKTVARFWSKVDRTAGPDACWPWIAFRNPKGYGLFNAFGDSSNTISHRFAAGVYEKGGVVRHSCDNPPCCNPAHLILGSQLDNVRDCRDKGRLRVPKRPRKLSEEQLAELRLRRANVESERSVAALFGVSRGYVWNVTRGQQCR